MSFGIFDYPFADRTRHNWEAWPKAALCHRRALIGRPPARDQGTILTAGNGFNWDSNHPLNNWWNILHHGRDLYLEDETYKSSKHCSSLQEESGVQRKHNTFGIFGLPKHERSTLQEALASLAIPDDIQPYPALIFIELLSEYSRIMIFSFKNMFQISIYRHLSSMLFPQNKSTLIRFSTMPSNLMGVFEMYAMKPRHVVRLNQRAMMSSAHCSEYEN